MKIARYSFVKAPGQTCSRRQALQMFTAGSTLPDTDTMAMVNKWSAGLDCADTVDGAAFRTQVATASEIVITLVDPPLPPPPPVMVPMSLERGDALLTVEVLRRRADQLSSSSVLVADTDRAATLRRIALRIETAPGIATSVNPAA